MLDGVPATTHWLARDLLATFGATVVHERVVEHGPIITAAGVSAGIDMGLRLVRLIHGDEAAKAVQLGIEYDPQPAFHAGAPEKAGLELVRAVSAGMDARGTNWRPGGSPEHAAALSER